LGVLSVWVCPLLNWCAVTRRPLRNHTNVPRDDHASTGKLPHVADVQARSRERAEERPEGLVVEADPRADP
jgi:hypothetical protein